MANAGTKIGGVRGGKRKKKKNENERKKSVEYSLRI